ncbi:MAG: hypothetical protein ACYC3W_02455 [Candidatus Nanopelagicales bacterium]
MTYKSIINLREFSTSQLIEELARRSNKRGEQKPRDWCENCTHFIPWIEGKTPEAPMPDTHNPCEMQHTMRFQVPECITDDYGFYRTVCADRQPKEQDEYGV